jgi:hypothetical protein
MKPILPDELGFLGLLLAGSVPQGSDGISELMPCGFIMMTIANPADPRQ